MGAAVTPRPAGSGLSDLIDSLIPLADHIMTTAGDNDPSRDMLHEVIAHVADLAIDEGDTRDTVRLKARAMRLIYAGHERGFEDGFAEDSLDGGSRAEKLAIQILGTLAASKS